MRPTADRVRELLRYEPDTGHFYWLVERHPSYPVGSRAGSQRAHGYIAISIDGCRYYAHQLAWLLMTGCWPPEIDHENGTRNDNRWINLRECTRQQNNGNRFVQRKYVHHDLPRGVIRVKNRGGSISYNGRIVFNNKQIHLGAYRTPDAAHAAYLQAAKQFFGEFARIQ